MKNPVGFLLRTRTGDSVEFRSSAGGNSGSRLRRPQLHHTRLSVTGYCWGLLKAEPQTE